MKDRPIEDEAILDLYFDRDERAIAETDRKYGKTCMNISVRILNSRLDAEECLNDTYIRLWDAIPPARPQSLLHYTLRVIRNLSLDRLRRLSAERRDRELVVSFEELADCIPVRDEQEGEISRLVSDFLRTESDTDRRLFLGRYWYHLSVKELAKQWSLTSNSVSLRLHRTRERLRTYLQEGGYTV